MEHVDDEAVQAPPSFVVEPCSYSELQSQTLDTTERLYQIE